MFGVVIVTESHDVLGTVATVRDTQRRARDFRFETDVITIRAVGTDAAVSKDDLTQAPLVCPLPSPKWKHPSESPFSGTMSCPDFRTLDCIP